MEDKNTPAKNIAETILDKMPAPRVTDNGGESLPYMVMPRSMEIESVERYEAKPRRLAANVSFSDVGGFVEYVNTFKSDASVLFANQRDITAIFDYHQVGIPSWCGHRATYEMAFTPEWIAWRDGQDTPKSQAHFASFLEALLSTVESPPSADVLGVIRGIQATATNKVVSVVQDDGINASLSFKRDVEVRGASQVELPKKLVVVVQPYVGVDLQYRLNVRLNYELTPNCDGIRFSYEILNFEGAERDAFDAMVKIVLDKTKVKAYVGGRFRN